jgi:hypothetical protein
MGQLLTSGSAGPRSLAFPPSLKLRRDKTAQNEAEGDSEGTEEEDFPEPTGLELDKLAATLRNKNRP